MTAIAAPRLDRRQRAARPGSAHDRIVKTLRVVLPMGVGVLGALLALAPFTNSDELSFVLDKDRVDVAKERLRVTEALYRGEDKQGRPFSLSAGSAVQKTSAEPIIDLNQLQARILLSDGPAQIRAGRGLYDMDAERVRVPGAVQVSGADGYRLTTGGVVIDLGDRTLASDDPVNGRTSLGTFRADRLRADLGARTVTLTGNAKLRIEQGALR